MTLNDNYSKLQETLTSRQATHGNYANVAITAQKLKDTYLRESLRAGTELSSVQCESLDMICSKMARIVCGNPNEPDHWHDIAGYATLAEKNCNNAVKTS